MFVGMNFAGLGGIKSSLQVVNYGSGCLLKKSLTLMLVIALIRFFMYLVVVLSTRST